ncbi:MAG: hypothetical protein KDC61_23860 [Saprospiraceae bacterium]|nr:hypothetical protein [Saprospiraceae bacterium]MCB0545027.1 hypothetical protein [Saprospiraceae bacterium]MCB0577618.1 hypothetical protein [Saprospiraceae bacterium]MCB9306156.1 hypothetical protein [Lewinellaceae bacterium]MCB9354824.1 hypothetical protein [Lewinellaceae bacterium]
MNRICLLFLSAASLFASCSPQLSVFNNKLYEDQNWSDDDLRRIQFYLSDDLTIYRYLDDDNATTIASGEIKIVDGRKTEQVHFKEGTPGVFLFRPKEDHFAISFENKDDSYFLTFGPNPRYGGQYMLLASEWDKRRGKVNYAGQKFFTASDEIPRLLVNLKKSSYRKTEVRTASGRSVNGSR